jgi:capsular exopolysaccharide synthesis family protein
MTAARKHLRTLIIDADIRRPTQHVMFHVPRDTGLLDLLATGSPSRPYVRATVLQNLDLLTAGREVPNPADLFDAARIGSVLLELRPAYDLILIDCAPLLPVSDPMLLASEVDGVLLIVKAGKTSRELVKRATEILRSTSGHLLGVVMNNLASVLPSHYDYNSYHYDYYSRPTDKLEGLKRQPRPSGESSSEHDQTKSRTSNPKTTR